MQKCRIKSVKHIGKKQSYNLTMKSNFHNYLLYDENINKGVISANSHSASYGYLSYTVAYLKANYTDEFICSLLNVEILRANHEKIEKYEKEFKRKLPIEILPRDINKCKALYTIEKKKDKSKGIIKTQIRRSLLCKGLGYNSAKNIEENQPYKDLKDFAVRTNKTIVDTKAFTSLVENNFIGRGKNIKAKEKLIKDFIIMRQDINNSLRKGVESGNIFE